MILAIDTSRGTSVALVADDGSVVRSATEHDARRHAEVIDVQLAAVLGDAAIDRVVAGMGPGAFTGLRVGIAAARAVGIARGVPVVGILSHDAVGATTDGLTQVTSDVRRRERAWSLYERGARLDGPHLAPADAVPAVPGARRIDADWIDAAGLVRALELGAAPVDAAVYLREPDAVVPTVRKRVS